MEVCEAVEAIREEYRRACLGHFAFNSPHEGWAVIFEEVEELWQEVRRRDHDPAALRAEAIQVGAMALRFLVELC